MPVHNLASLEDLAEHLGGLSERRPPRKQQIKPLSPTESRPRPISTFRGEGSG
jgi:hypothetical protein